MKHNQDSSSINTLNWIENAKDDLKLAEIASQYDIIASLICFHAQQAAEKALKAVLLHHKINFPLVHDLEALLTLLEKNDVEIPEDVQDAGKLTPFAVETRYPGIWDDISEEEQQESIKLAQSVISWAESEIKK